MCTRGTTPRARLAREAKFGNASQCADNGWPFKCSSRCRCLPTSRTVLLSHLRGTMGDLARRSCCLTLLVSCVLAQSPLPLPANPERDCSREVVYQATSKDLSCGRAVWAFSGLTPGADCCRSLSDYFGPNSTLPSKNCFCVPSIAEKYFLANEPTDDYTAELIGFSTLLSGCTLQGYTVNYWSNDLGPCAGLPASTIPSTFAAYTTKSPRSFGSWVRFLKHDGVLGFAFAVGLLSAVGFLLMAWPVLFDAGATVVELFHKGGPESSLGGLKPCSAALAPSTPDYKLQT